MNWIPLNEIEYAYVWEKFNKHLKFNPSINKKDWPSFKEPKPFITYDISPAFRFPNMINDFDKNVIKALQECISDGEYIYALDWQHECYWYNPYLESPCNNFGDQPIPFFPNGDYYCFLQKDFEWGLLGHPWEQTICIFGNQLINATTNHKPQMFDKILRSYLD